MTDSTGQRGSFSCILRSEVTPENCEKQIEGKCNPGDGKGCVCCKKPQEPCVAKQRRCSRLGAGHLCVQWQEALEWPVDCYRGFCKSKDHHPCMCCPPKPAIYKCEDVGCSGPDREGYTCQNETTAANWNKTCTLSNRLCNTIWSEFTINITADNEFEIYSDPPDALGTPFGSGNSWSTTDSFNTDAGEYLTIRAENYHLDMGILLSTSEGLVSDNHWRCIDERQAQVTPFHDWPQALELYDHGDWVWGDRPGIAMTAKWIWAPAPPGGRAPDNVICYRKLDRGRCYCCPPLDPPNMCKPNGTRCERAFGDFAVGECVDVTNLEGNSFSNDYDLEAKPQGNQLCIPTDENSCCRCVKRKTCQDDGCEEEFRGHGVCVDPRQDDLSNIDLTAKQIVGKCTSPLGENCCQCRKKKVPMDASCRQKDCYTQGIQGVCVANTMTPPKGHTSTDADCGAPHCTCWVPDMDCLPDTVCTETLHGMCVPEGEEAPSYHRPSNYKCKTLPGKNCTCWTPYCENPNCRGVCLLPWDPVPPGFTQTDLYCNEQLRCKCYIYTPPPCDQTESCKDLDGECRSEPMDGESVLDARCEEGCKCYGKREECKNERCEKTKGVCVLRGDPVPDGHTCGVGPVEWCDKELGCQCCYPKCKNNKCTKNYKGTCYMPNEIRPDTAVELVVNNKPVYCNKKMQCKCYINER